jgi:hypothetical protein
MSEHYIIDKSTLTAIGDAIRSKGVITETRTLPVHRRSPHITDEHLGSDGYPAWFELPNPADGVELNYAETFIIHGASSLKVVGECVAPTNSLGDRLAELWVDTTRYNSSSTSSAQINQTIVGDEVRIKYNQYMGNASYGYFLYIHAYDANGEEMTSYDCQVSSSSKMFLPSEMAPAIMAIGDSIDTDGTSVADFKGLVEGTMAALEGEDTITKIRDYGFYNNKTLESVNCPRATEVGARAFYGCSSLQTANLPQVRTFNGEYVFGSCNVLKEVKLPKLTEVPNNTFRSCSSLAKADFTSVTAFTGTCFYDSKRLALIIRNTEVKATASSTSLLPAASSFTGGIYVPRNFVNAYKNDAVWKTWADKIYAIEDHPEICG